MRRILHNVDLALPFYYLVSSLHVEQSNTDSALPFHYLVPPLCVEQSSQYWFSATVPLSGVTTTCGTVQHNVDSALPFHYLVPSLCGTVQHSVDSALPFHYLVSPLHVGQSNTMFIQFYHFTILCQFCVEQSNTMLIQLYHSTILCHLCVEQSNTLLIQRYHSAILCHLCTWNSPSQCWFSSTNPLSCVTSPCRTVQHHVHSVLSFHYLVSALHVEQSSTIFIQFYHFTILCHLYTRDSQDNVLLYRHSAFTLCCLFMWIRHNADSALLIPYFLVSVGFDGQNNLVTCGGDLVRAKAVFSKK